MTAARASLSIDLGSVADSVRSLTDAGRTTERAAGMLASLGDPPPHVPGGAGARASAAVGRARSTVPRQAALLIGLASELKAVSDQAARLFSQPHVAQYVLSGLGTTMAITTRRQDLNLRTDHARRLTNIERDLKRSNPNASRRDVKAIALARLAAKVGPENLSSEHRRRYGADRARQGLRNPLDDGKRPVRDLATRTARRGVGLGGARPTGAPGRFGGAVGLASSAYSVQRTLRDPLLSGADKRRAVATTATTNVLLGGGTALAAMAVPGAGWAVGGLLLADGLTGGHGARFVAKGAGAAVGAAEDLGKGVAKGASELAGGAAAVGKDAVGLIKKIPSPF